jgi:hypothetical protein
MRNHEAVQDAAVESAVIEWAPFRLAPGVSEATLLDASERLQREFLERRQGFVRRELLRGADGQWVDLLYWSDEDSANAVMADISTSPACQAYFSLMVGADVMDAGAGVLHLHRVRSYPAHAA